MTAALPLFAGYGVELEYMIVDAATLDVRPLCDRLLELAAADLPDEQGAGELYWSNEIVLHVVELKTNGPAAALPPLSAAFQRDVGRINELLHGFGATLLPTAMHPWMDPRTETRLWPHDFSDIYQTYDRVFGCSGHGWSNMQSAHLNLPFLDDGEFGRLHAAARLALPLIPALAASSPLVELRETGLADTRLEYYRNNQRRVPVINGAMIPEQAYTRAEYDELILGPIYRAVAQFDPDKVISHEWLNSRGAIARFERNTVELRLLDIQECPAADVAIISLLTALIRALVEQRCSNFERQAAWPVEPLAELLLQTLRRGDLALVRDAQYLATLGLDLTVPCSAGALCSALAQRLRPLYPELLDPAWPALELIFERGTLSRRISAALGGDLRPATVRRVYAALARCLAAGALFDDRTLS